MIYRVDLTEEQMSIVMQALSHFQYQNPYITVEQFEISNDLLDKLDELL